MSDFVSVAMSGLSYGAVFALAAVGFLIIYKGTGVINLAQGDLITMSAYVMIWSSTLVGMPWFVAVLASFVVMFCSGMLLERVVVAPLRSRNVVVSVVATLGASLVIQAGLNRWQGAQPKVVPSPFSDKTFAVGSATIQVQQVVLIVATVLILLLVLWGFHRTAIGRDLRALASDRETATLYGVPVARLSMASWGLGASLAAVAGVLAGPIAPVDLNYGFALMFGAFGAVMLGGFGSIVGAAIAAAIIGLSRALLGFYILEDYAVLVPHLVIILVIALRPMGLFGRAEERL